MIRNAHAHDGDVTINTYTNCANSSNTVVAISLLRSRKLLSEKKSELKKTFYDHPFRICRLVTCVQTERQRDFNRRSGGMPACPQSQ